jgi:hypothetical protein
MTLVALTQEPEVKVRLAMIGKWCLDRCPMRFPGECDTWCVLYDTALECVYDSNAPPEASYQRCPACIAAHGGAE